MGLTGKLFKDIVSAVSEQSRINRTSRAEEINLSDEQRVQLDNLIEKAEIGDISAMVSLAEMYYEGKVLRYDPYEFCKWWTKAAEAGNVGSMYNLGLLYCGDLSTSFYDNEKAAYWLNEASRRGDQEAWETLNERFKYSNFRGKWIRK